MADIMKAVEWMKEGKKVKHSDWGDGSFVCFDSDCYEFKSSMGVDYDFGIQEFERKDWEIYKEEDTHRFDTECMKGGLWLSAMGRIVLDNHNCETFAKPHDKKLLTAEELESGIKLKDFQCRLLDALRDNGD